MVSLSFFFFFFPGNQPKRKDYKEFVAQKAISTSSLGAGAFIPTEIYAVRVITISSCRRTIFQSLQSFFIASL